MSCLYLCDFVLLKKNSTCFNTIIHNTLACIQYSVIASGLFSDFKIKCFLKRMNRSYKSWKQSCLRATLLTCESMSNDRGSNIDLTSLWFIRYDVKDKCNANYIKYRNGIFLKIEVHTEHTCTCINFYPQTFLFLKNNYFLWISLNFYRIQIYY